MLNSDSVSKVLPIFARHETFHPRFGWLKKGYDKATEDNSVFVNDNATIRLGVGKNMVRAIRFWCHTFKVLDRTSNKPTTFGKALLSDNGWDPYLEDPSSLWLLHWTLIKPPCLATTWFFVFNLFSNKEFTAEELIQNLMEYKKQVFPSDRTVESSLRKDVNCLLRMYAGQGKSSGPIEDTLDSPFVTLGLIQRSPDSRYYSFNTMLKANLASEIIVSACLEFAKANNVRTVSISRFLYDVGSPGFVFKLTENALCSAIEDVARFAPQLQLSDNAGLVQFSYEGDTGALVQTILDCYYGRGTGDALQLDQCKAKILPLS